MVFGSRVLGSTSLQVDSPRVLDFLWVIKWCFATNNVFRTNKKTPLPLTAPEMKDKGKLYITDGQTSSARKELFPIEVTTSEGKETVQVATTESSGLKRKEDPEQGSALATGKMDGSDKEP